MDLKVAFDVEEAHGSTNPIENSFESEEINLPISINNLEYINYIDKVVLDPSVSQLHFTTGINNDFGQFNLDADSKIIVSFPSEYVFSDNITLPTDVKRVDGTNDFEVSSMSVFNNTEWILPIREVKVQSEVVDGVLDLETKAIVRAVSSGKDEVLTIGAVDNVPLKKTANELSGKRNITLSVSPIEMSVIDVQGRINPIGIDFQSRIFNELDFEINDLDHVKAVEYIEFDSEQKIYITSSSDKEFSNMKLEEGSCIALRFPEDIFVFDQQHSTLPYDNKLKAFVINDLAQLKSGNWSLALKRININKEIVDTTLSLNFMVSLEAINSRGESDKLYVVSDGNFSLDKMRKQHLFGLHNIEFTVEGPAEGISIKEMKGKSNDVEVAFDGEEVNYTFTIDSLDYITHIGYIELKEKSNYLRFHSTVSGELGCFNLSPNSYGDIVFPEEFKLDPQASSIPNGMAKFVDNNQRIRVYDLNALDYADDWRLAVKRIDIDKDIVDYGGTEHES